MKDNERAIVANKSEITKIRSKMLFNRISNQFRCILESIPELKAASKLANPLLEKYKAAIKPKDKSPAF